MTATINVPNTPTALTEIEARFEVLMSAVYGDTLVAYISGYVHEAQGDFPYLQCGRLYRGNPETFILLDGTRMDC